MHKAPSSTETRETFIWNVIKAWSCTGSARLEARLTSMVNAESWTERWEGRQKKKQTMQLVTPSTEEMARERKNKLQQRERGRGSHLRQCINHRLVCTVRVVCGPETEDLLWLRLFVSTVVLLCYRLIRILILPAQIVTVLIRWFLQETSAPDKHLMSPEILRHHTHLNLHNWVLIIVRISMINCTCALLVLP